MIDVVDRSLRAAFDSAIDHGIPTSTLVSLTGDVLRPMIVDEIRDGFATDEEGLNDLLTAEGGCVNVEVARKLFKKPGGVTRQAIGQKIRDGEVIAYQSGGGQYVVPKWQFRREGGLLKGLPEVLAALHEKLPDAGELTPFAFFLQEDPVTEGETPLKALRAGRVEQVLKAVSARAG